MARPGAEPVKRAGPVRVLHAASEVYPLVSTGGLASVAADLPRAQLRHGNIHAAVVIPLYETVAGKCGEIRWHGSMETAVGEEFGLGSVDLDGLTVFLVARDEFFLRTGIYGPGSGEEWPDNPHRYSFFSRAVAALGCSGHFQPDIIHCHDWQTALVPVYLRNTDIPTVLTIHNLQFQGRFPRSTYPATGLPDTLYNIDGLEFWGDWNCLKGGIVHARRITTVSPGYAREILTEEFGCALEGVLREHSSRLSGILNGIDTETWNPQTDPCLPFSFGPGDIRGKAGCRAALAGEMELDPTPGGMLLGMVSRLTAQKGVDTVLDSIGSIVSSGARLAVLGTGEPWAEKALSLAAKAFPGRVSVRIAYDDRLARLVFAGSDGFLMPSRFEPCGLAQMMAMRYGSVPLVRSVGGLADTVDGKRGFSFRGDDSGFLPALAAMKEAWENPRRWAWYRRKCMNADLSWKNSVEEYSKVYEEALEKQ